MEPIDEEIEKEPCACSGECHCHKESCTCDCEGECCCAVEEEEQSSFYPELATMRWDADDFNDWD